MSFLIGWTTAMSLSGSRANSCRSSVTALSQVTISSDNANSVLALFNNCRQVSELRAERIAAITGSERLSSGSGGDGGAGRGGRGGQLETSVGALKLPKTPSEAHGEGNDHHPRTYFHSR